MKNEYLYWAIAYVVVAVFQFVVDFHLLRVFYAFAFFGYALRCFAKWKGWTAQ